MLNFLIVSCKSIFIDILGRSFMVILDAVASAVYLKVTYHDAEGMSATVSANVDEVKRIK